VCLTVVKDAKLSVRLDAQSDVLRQRVGGRGIEVPAATMGLTDYASREEAVVHQDLTQAQQHDLRLMSRAFGASLHVPTKVDGHPGTVTFWSRESQAFPPAAAEFLEQVAELMKRPE
jgi:hypothetical protein